MGRNSIKGDTKLCTGPLHREGVWLPLTSFYQHRDGKPFPQCIDCRNFYLGRPDDAGLISRAAAEPVLQVLYDLAGGRTKAAEMLGLPRNAFSRKTLGLRRSTFNSACKLITELDCKRHYNRGEPEVVDAEPLGSILRDWMVMWLREHPAAFGDSQFGHDRDQSVAHMGPIQWLHHKTGINTRQIRGIANGEFHRVSLSKADALLQAIDKPGLLGNEIPVKMSPSWSMETWIAYMASRGCI